jgi:hypothetical protein
MWEARAAYGRVEELVAFVVEHAHADADVYRSAGGQAGRVVVIDPTGVGVPDVPGELVARPPHVWPFEAVPRG